MKKIVIYFFNVLLTYFLFAQEIPLSKSFVHQDNLNKSNIYISTFDTVFYNLKNGVIFNKLAIDKNPKLIYTAISKSNLDLQQTC